MAEQQDPEKVSIGAELTSLPLGQMLSGPLMAAIEAQALSAVHTADFITSVGLNEDGEVITLPFKFNNSVTDPATGDVLERETELSVPLLSIVEPPHLAINDLSVSFEFKIRDVMSKKTQAKYSSKWGTEASTTGTVTGSAGGGLLGWLGAPKGEGTSTTSVKTNFNVSATYQQSARHDTDRSATLKMTMNAQQRVPEGFIRVLSILNDSIKAQAQIPPPPPASGGTP